MATFRDAGIVLRTHKLAEADRIITLLTHDHGKVRAVAKGVRRPRSRFGARLEPFMHVDLQLYEGRSLDTVTQAVTLAAYAAPITASYPAFTAANAVVEAADKLSPVEHVPARALFRLTLGAVAALARGAASGPSPMNDAARPAPVGPSAEAVAGSGGESSPGRADAPTPGQASAPMADWAARPAPGRGEVPTTPGRGDAPVADRASRPTPGWANAPVADRASALADGWASSPTPGRASMPADGQASAPMPGAVVDSYLLRALALSGYAPALTDCALCGAAGPHRAFSAAAGGMVCQQCRPPGAAAPSAPAVTLLGALLEGDWARVALAGPAPSAEAAALVRSFAEFHMERAIQSLRLLDR